MGSKPPLFRVRSARFDAREARRVSRNIKKSVTITVSRREAPLAVTRNRVRRRIRAAIRKSGVVVPPAVTIIGTSRAATARFTELLEETTKTFPTYE